MKHGLATAGTPSWSFAGALLLFGSLAPAVGCSSSPSSSSSSVKCGATQCGPGSDCIDDGSGPRCQKVCTKQADCPFNWFCNDGQPKSWCAPGTYTFTKQPGQWGDSCPPSGGEANAACDAAEGFGCYGTSPTDAYAMCTIFDCAKDRDCPGGW